MVLIQIKYIWNSEEASEVQISRGGNSSYTNKYFQKPIMQIKYFCTIKDMVVEVAQGRFQGVETSPKPIHISKGSQLYL